MQVGHLTSKSEHTLGWCPEVGWGGRGGWREAVNAEASLASKTDCCSAFNRF